MVEQNKQETLYRDKQANSCQGLGVEDRVDYKRTWENHLGLMEMLYILIILASQDYTHFKEFMEL